MTRAGIGWAVVAAASMWGCCEMVGPNSVAGPPAGIALMDRTPDDDGLPPPPEEIVAPAEDGCWAEIHGEVVWVCR